MTSIVYTIIFIVLLILTLTDMVKIKAIAIASISFIFLSTLFIIFNFENISELFAVLGYLSLTTGVVTEAVRFYRSEAKEKKELQEIQIPKLNVATGSYLYNERIYNSRKLFMFIAGIISFILTAGMIFFSLKTAGVSVNLFGHNIEWPKLFTGGSKNKLIRPEAEKIEPSLTPIPTMPRVDVKSLAIIIRNGTIINGLASRSAEILKKQDYKNVRIADADKQDYKSWVLYYPPEFAGAAEKVREDLGIKSINLEEKTGTQAAGIVIIAGTEK